MQRAFPGFLILALIIAPGLAQVHSVQAYPQASGESTVPQGSTQVLTPGMALVAQGKLAEAMPLLDAECAKSPDDPKLGLARAQCMLDLARWKEALAAGQGLLERFPGDADIRIMVGEALFVSFRPSDAVETWRPLLKDPKEGARALPRMLGALLSQRRFEEAGALAAQAKAAGIAFNDAALGWASQAGVCPEKLAFLEELGKRHPAEMAVMEEIKAQRGVCEKGGAITSVTGTLPGKIRKAKLNGKKNVDIGFDSGSQSIVLYAPKWGKTLGMPELGQALFAGLGEKGALTVRKVLLNSLEAGNIRISNLPVILGKADEIVIRMGLGPFLNYVVEFDHRKNRRVLWPAGTSAEAIFGKKPEISLPVLWFRGIPLVPVSINGMGPYPFLFDTGASSTILAAQFCPLLGLRPASGLGEGTGASGAFPIRSIEEVTLSIGGREETPPWIHVTEIPQNFSGPVYGFLGQDFIGDYRLVFDGPGCRIHLLRYSSGRYRDPLHGPPPIRFQAPSPPGQDPRPTDPGRW